jgi:uncharacterized protein (DUF302 family)
MLSTPQNLAADRRWFLWIAALFAGVAATGRARAETSLEGRRRSEKESMPMAMGLTTVPSSFAAKETMDRLEAAAKAKGLTVFARVDHAGGAAAVGLSLRPTELIIFGNARGGTPLMRANQTAGIDLPLKALVYEDAVGKVWLAYNDPAWIARRHGLDSAVDGNVNALSEALGALARHATQAA